MIKRMFDYKVTIKFSLIFFSVLLLCSNAYANSSTMQTILPKLCIDSWNHIVNCQQPADYPAYEVSSHYTNNYKLTPTASRHQSALFAKIKKSCRVTPSRSQHSDFWQRLEQFSELQFIIKTHSTFNIEMNPSKGQVSEVSLSYQNCW